MSFKAQFGLAEETTWGTAVAPTRFYEFLPGESLMRRQTVLTSQALAKNVTFARGRRRVLTKNDAGGSITFEIANLGMGIFFKHMLGSVTTSALVAGVAFQHTFVPDILDTKSLTLQKGVEKVNGGVEAFTYAGAKVVSWDMNIAVDEIAQLELEFDAREESTAVALGTAVYQDVSLLHFGQASLYMDESTTPIADVSEVSLNGANALNVERYHLGQLGFKKEPRHNDLRSLGGELTAEFTDLSLYNKFKADTSAILVVELVGANIGTTSFKETVRIRLNDVRFTGETPKIEDPEVGRQSINFEAFTPLTTATDTNPITITYITADATP